MSVLPKISRETVRTVELQFACPCPHLKMTEVVAKLAKQNLPLLQEGRRWANDWRDECGHLMEVFTMTCHMLEFQSLSAMELRSLPCLTERTCREVRNKFLLNSEHLSGAVLITKMSTENPVLLEVIDHHLEHINDLRVRQRIRVGYALIYKMLHVQAEHDACVVPS